MKAGRYMSILELNYIDAKNYFLQSNVYCSINLPNYFNFDDVLKQSSLKLQGKNFNDFVDKENDLRNIYSSFSFSVNKDGAYQWRKLSLINPMIYVKLVNDITKEENWEQIKERFKLFQSNEKIKCCSMPITNIESLTKETIINWWESFEQEIINLSGEYNVMGVTDISNCYSSIYTHTISWAIHGKDFAKENKRNSHLLGNIIDNDIGLMQCGQTNGLPEGSIISDFIAEIILGYADLLISERLHTDYDYKILRYRDDYRIFTNDKTQVEMILKIISEVLLELNLKLNSKKTYITSNILDNAIKEDRLYLLHHPIVHKSFQKRLYSIWKLANKYPGCGSVKTELSRFYSRFSKVKNTPANIDQLIAITINIMYISSNYFPICVAILSKLASISNDYDLIIKKIKKKFSTIPNTDYLDIWLQRLTLKTGYGTTYDCDLCKKVDNIKNDIWDWTWLKGQKIKENIINEDVINNLNIVINVDEISIFDNY